jgi:hypothetical protein
MRLAAVLAFVVSSGLASATEPCCELTPQRMLRMSECQLLDLYRGGAAKPPPTGFVDGWSIYKPGRLTTAARAHATRLLWRGKEFSPAGDGMINHVGRLRIVRADVFPGESWLDGGPTYVFDYLHTSKLFSNVRDEVREVAPGVFLGLTYLRKPCGAELTVFFVLDARCR